MASEKYTAQQDYPKSSVDHVEIPNQSAVHHVDVEELPSGYWRSYRFLGSVLAIILLANSLFIGYVMPVSTTVLNQEGKPLIA